ncbi:Metallo-dependent phosphatase-like protein, partial [Piptocephalis cylindrospora]
EQEDTIRLLLATDNHVGYLERDPVRGDDAARTFEEIILMAKEHDVDALVLSGDLFHENKPSRKSMHRVASLLREHCLGDRPCSLELVSDPSINFPDQFSTVNYQDPNINVSLPIFTIHGNHDDPTGEGDLAAMDLLSISGLVNHFGRTTAVDDVRISPVLLRKGSTYLSLYGLGALRDERLHRAFLQQQVRLFRPPPAPTATTANGDWFNMFLIHQNRVPHGPTSYIPEHFIDDSMDLVIWGHEHDCRIDPEWNPRQEFYVVQPGSSVATSLSEGETKRKHVALLEIKGRSFRLKKLPLRTVRPFVMDNVCLSEQKGLRPTHPASVEAFLKTKVQEMLLQAKDQWEEEEKERGSESEGTARDFPKPLIRLKVDYSGGFSTLNTQRFGQQFSDQVANPREILHFHRRRLNNLSSTEDKERKGKSLISINGMDEDKLDDIGVVDLVKEYLQDQGQTLDILPVAGMDEAVRQFTDKEEKDAIRR